MLDDIFSSQLGTLPREDACMFKLELRGFFLSLLEMWGRLEFLPLLDFEVDQLSEQGGPYVTGILNHSGRSYSVSELGRYPVVNLVLRAATESTFCQLLKVLSILFAVLLETEKETYGEGSLFPIDDELSQHIAALFNVVSGEAELQRLESAFLPEYYAGNFWLGGFVLVLKNVVTNPERIVPFICQLCSFVLHMAFENAFLI
ncbi:hypothetical transcript [Echinococcus multilocularis]|uniref:Hypothetical transcript n=1 Tax=Echinococcus multilocularis TaxID=6211 RepID=A0A068YBE2_ECHMU|nr:hypothetical transcript [Echinococcus multilocularis]